MIDLIVGASHKVFEPVQENSLDMIGRRDSLHGPGFMPINQCSKPILVRRSVLPSAPVRGARRIRFDPAFRLHIKRTVGTRRRNQERGTKYSVFHAVCMYGVAQGALGLPHHKKKKKKRQNQKLFIIGGLDATLPFNATAIPRPALKSSPSCFKHSVQPFVLASVVQHI